MNLMQSIEINRKIASLIESKHADDPAWGLHRDPEFRYYELLQQDINLALALIRSTPKETAPL